jgi:hypothetical protein
MFHTTSGEELLVGLPLVLPMGWIQPPPLFTSATETVADLANQHMVYNVPCAPHLLDFLSKAPPATSRSASSPTCGPIPRPLPKAVMAMGWHRPAVKSWDVYVDNVIRMVQGLPTHRRHVKLILLHTLDTVFCILESGDDSYRQEPASLQKC